MQNCTHLPSALRYVCAAVIGVLLVGLCCASSVAAEDEDLTELTLDDLSNIQVTSFSKRSASLSSTPAAVYVITSEDIERSGLSSIPELLRLVPGMQVARATAHSWAISSRGFADDFSSKLLVMIDGRSVYSPFHAGVMWNIQDLVIEDIDRIEVIRGPGGAIWGANAVNGVVNIITKDASKTVGILTPAESGGTADSYAMRYGSRRGDHSALRVYMKDTSVRDFPYSDVTDPSVDGYDHSRAGFRYDIDVAESDRLSVQGDMYTGDGNNNPWTDDVSTHVSGGDFMLSYYNSVSPSADSVLQIYYDKTVHDDSVLYSKTGTTDVDYTFRRKLADDRELTWGVGSRLIHDTMLPSTNVLPVETSLSYNTFSAFLQEDRKVSANGLRVIAGSKFETNSFSGFEIQPSLRAWMPISNDSSMWASVSRAVRTPSRMETGVGVQFDPKMVNGIPTVRRVFPNPDMQSEDMISYELGYRLKKGRRWSLDVASYYNKYNHLRTVEVGTPFLEMSPAPPHGVIPLTIDNNMKGRVFGLEAAADWNVTQSWRVIGGFAWQECDVDLTAISNDPYSVELFEDSLPQTQLQMQSRWSVNSKFDVDVLYFHVDRLTAKNIPGYDRVDLRLGWRPKPQLKVAIGVQNVFNDYHSEWDRNVLLPRTVYTKAVWDF